MNKTISKKRILVVDDDPAVLKMFGTLLIRGGYEVIEASYALPAIFRVIRSLPDLILVDLNMPMMNGLQLIGQFKGHFDTRDIPVLVVTGSVSEESREAAFKAGCAGYLTKPVGAVKLLAQIEKLLPDHKRGKPETPQQPGRGPDARQWGPSSPERSQRHRRLKILKKQFF